MKWVSIEESQMLDCKTFLNPPRQCLGREFHQTADG